MLQFVKKLFFKIHAQWQCFVPRVAGRLSVFSAERQTLRNFGLTARPPVGAFLNGAMPEIAPGISGNWSAVVAFTNLLFTNAVGLTSVPGTDELCVWEREGRVWTFQNSPGATRKKTRARPQQPMPGLGRFRAARHRVSSGLCDEPFRVRLLHLGQARHGRRRSPTTRPDSDSARHLSRPARTLHARRERRGDSRLRKQFSWT